MDFNGGGPSGVVLARPCASRGLAALRLSGALLLALLHAADAQSDPPAPAAGARSLHVEIGFTRYAFSNVNRSDAEAAFKVFAQAFSRHRGYELTSTTHVFDNHADFEKAIQAGQIDLVIVDTWRFLEMDVHRLVTPCFVTTHQGSVGKRYAVLCRRDGSFRRLEDLRGREILEIEVTNANLGRSWLETQLMSRGLGTHDSFFGRVRDVNRASGAVLPVFFGKKDACLVDEASFLVMKELNPQVGEVLQIIETSEPLTDAVICLRNDGWKSPQHKDDIIRALAELESEADGRQILTLFKIDQLQPFTERQLDTVRELHATYDRLRKGATP